MSALPSEIVYETIDDETVARLSSAVQGLTREQLLWASGYLAGVAATRAADASVPSLATLPTAAAPWHIFYGTETGNSRRIAQALDEQLRAAGVATLLADLRDFEPKALRKVRRATFIVATHGLGDPPEGTEAFFDHWLGERAPRLEELTFAVLALGDSTYEEFCAFGRRWDERLATLGARRVQPRAECDVDYEAPAAAWRAAIAATIAAEAEPAHRDLPRNVATLRSERRPAAPPGATRDAPFAAPVLVNQRITGSCSTKDVRHLELSLEGSGIAYEPGDSIGVWPRNPAQLVTAVLDVTGLHADAEVRVAGETLTLGEALAAKLEITQLSRAVVRAYAELSSAAELERVLASSEALHGYLATHQVVDMLAEHRAQLEPQAFAEALRALTPRLYSAASSPMANPGEVHLTVSLLAYERFGRLHEGAASAFLARADAAPIYVEQNGHFRLPRDGSLPIVMIGAGTGIAPYRAFMQHRREQGATGKAWLIFGERTLRDDFLYQIEWLRYRESGALTRLDAAFSRDQAEKVYVQHKILERATELYGWLENGARLYVCGDADGMAPAVDAALLDVVRRAGGKSSDAAEEYLQSLKTEKRYLRDVY